MLCVSASSPGGRNASSRPIATARADWPGLVRGAIIKTGEDGYCLIGEWAEPRAIAAACNSMIETLNSFRDTLDAAGPGQGVTDAVSGAVVLELPQKR